MFGIPADVLLSKGFCQNKHTRSNGLFTPLFYMHGSLCWKKNVINLKIKQTCEISERYEFSVTL